MSVPSHCEPVVTGRGETTIVLSHGFGTTQSIWDRLRPWLDERFRVVSYDLAGATGRHADGFAFERYTDIGGWADDLLALLDGLGIRDAIYLGHSVSGMIGMLAGLQAPELFSRMVMIAPSPRYLDDDGYHGGFTPDALETLFRAMSSSYRSWVAGFAPAVVAQAAGQPAVEEFSRGLFDMRPDIALHMARVVFGSDLRRLVPQHAVPTLILQTRDDLAVPLDVARWLHARWPDSRLEMLDAAGHLPHLTAPGAVLDALERHLV